MGIGGLIGLVELVRARVIFSADVRNRVQSGQAAKSLGHLSRTLWSLVERNAGADAKVMTSNPTDRNKLPSASRNKSSSSTTKTKACSWLVSLIIRGTSPSCRAAHPTIINPAGSSAIDQRGAGPFIPKIDLVPRGVNLMLSDRMHQRRSGRETGSGEKVPGAGPRCLHHGRPAQEPYLPRQAAARPLRACQGQAGDVN